MCLSCAYSKASLINVRFAKMERPGTAQAWQGEIIVGMTGLSLEWTTVATSLLSVFKRVIGRQDFGLVGGRPFFKNESNSAFAEQSRFLYFFFKEHFNHQE